MFYRPRLKATLKGLCWVLLGCLFFHINALHNFVWAGKIPLISQEPGILQEVIVRYRPEANFADIINMYKQFNLNELSYSPYSGTTRIRVPAQVQASFVADLLKQHPLVAFAEPNYLRSAHFIPNDPIYQYQWHLNSLIMQQVWDLTLGEGVLVAVVDSGIAYRDGDGYMPAPDLADSLIIPGYDFVNDDPSPDDDNHHGTHISGTIAQSTNNLFGGAGIAPGCPLMAVKVLDDTGYGSTTDIVDGIYYAVNNGAQIINMSLGGARVERGRRRDVSTIEEEAVNYALSEGVTVICSAGNDASDLPNYPASYEATISVSACKYDQDFASAYSTYGPTVDICAPGGDRSEDVNADGHPDGIYQQTHDGVDYTLFDFYFFDGTSSAAAFVSGVAALILSSAAKPLTPVEVREIITSTAIDRGDPGWDQYYGWGLIDPLAAVQTAITYSVESRWTQNIIQSVNSRILASQILPSLINPALLPAFPFTTNALQRVSHQTANFENFSQPFSINREAFSFQGIAPYQSQGQGNYLTNTLFLADFTSLLLWQQPLWIQPQFWQNTLWNQNLRNIQWNQFWSGENSFQLRFN